MEKVAEEKKMKWSIFFRKIFQGFLTGGTAAVVGQTVTGKPPTNQEEAVQSATVGLLSALMVGLSNYLKYK